MEDKELFEVWKRDFERDIKPHFNPTNPDYNSRNKYGDYFYAHMNLAWTSYLIAKRSQPSVVLPSSKSFPSIGHPMDKLGVHGYELALSDVKSALTAAGIKYTIGE